MTRFGKPRCDLRSRGTRANDKNLFPKVIHRRVELRCVYYAPLVGRDAGNIRHHREPILTRCDHDGVREYDLTVGRANTPPRGMPIDRGHLSIAPDAQSETLRVPL